MIIYKATNKGNGKVYVGQTAGTLHDRSAQHIKDSTHPRGPRSYFSWALQEYGKEQFDWEVLKTCRTKKELDEQERRYIKQFQSDNPEHGYNESPGGGGDRKLGKLQAVLSKSLPGTVITSSWLESVGVYRQLTQRYLASGFLAKLGHGAFIRSGDTVDWLGGVYALQEQLKLPVHVTADTALQLRGLGHFLPLGGRQTVHLFGDPGVSLPNWFLRHSWGVQVRYHQPRLFDDSANIGFGDVRRERFSVRTASPERAILESIYLASDNSSWEYAHLLMGGLSTLRPAVVQTLLEACSSVRVKRYFLWSAETSGHAWFGKLNMNRVDLGSGKRQLFKGGVYDAKYRITVPRVNEDQPQV